MFCEGDASDMCSGTQHGARMVAGYHVKQVWTRCMESLPYSYSDTGMCGRGLPIIRSAETGVTSSDPWLGELGTPVWCQSG